MKKRRYNYTTLGLLLGTAAGGGVGVILYLITGQQFFLTLAGVGMIVGLAAGASVDRNHRRR